MIPSSIPDPGNPDSNYPASLIIHQDGDDDERIKEKSLKIHGRGKIPRSLKKENELKKNHLKIHGRGKIPRKSPDP